MKRYRPTNQTTGSLMEPHEYGDYIRHDDPAIKAAVDIMERLCSDSHALTQWCPNQCRFCQDAKALRLALAGLKEEA